MANKIEAFERFIELWGKRFNWVAIGALAVMLCIVVVDILGGKLFRWPIPGSVDIMGLTGAIVTAFAIAQTQILGRHIRVDFLLIRLPRRSQSIIGLISSFFSLALFALIIGVVLKYAVALQASGKSSFTLEIPFFPFVYAITLAFIPLFLVLLGEFFRSIMKVRQK